MIFLPTPSARRATVRAKALAATEKEISTHALREEGDGKGCINSSRLL